MEIQWTQNSQTHLEKRNNVGKLTIPDFNTCHKAIIIKTIILS